MAPSTAAAPAAGTRPAGWDGVERREEKVQEFRAASAPVKEDSIRVDAVKLDALLEVAGESVQAANQAAVLLEPCKRILPEHPGPRIGIITRGIAVAPDVEEIVRAVARRNVRDVEAALVADLLETGRAGDIDFSQEIADHV